MVVGQLDGWLVGSLGSLGGAGGGHRGGLC